MSSSKTTLRLSSEHLVVSEIFHSIQGEGPTVGWPSVFLRLGFCNLHCEWCDTKYSWSAKEYDLTSELQRQSIEEIKAALRVFPSKNLVVTGGEPLLQQDALELLLTHIPHRIELETAGTRKPSATLIKRISQWNVSPKLASSQNALRKRYKPAVLDSFVALDSSIFKFVISDENDLREAERIIREFSISPDRVWLTPEGRDVRSLTTRQRWLATICARDQYRLGQRLHIFLWADRRGT